MTQILARNDRILRLRVAAAPADPLATRRRIERALSAVTLRPAGVSSHFIICVKRIRAEMPARAGAWGDRLDRALQPLIACAVRPFRQPVPANADVIAFADEAELLACFARDWSRGEGDAWWWHSLFGAAASEALVRATFVQNPEAVPEALERLSDGNEAIGVLARLSSPSCEAIATAMARVFAVPGWIVAAPAPIEDMGHVAGVPPDLAPWLASRVRRAVRAVRAVDVAPLANASRDLLALALVLRRDPPLARRRDVWRLLRDCAWAAPPVPPNAGGAEGDVERPLAAAAGAEWSAARDDVSALTEPREVNTVQQATHRRSVVSDRSPMPRSAIDSEASLASSPEPRAGSTEAIASRAPAVAGVDPEAPREATADALRLREPYTDTAYAGVIYLVNLALRLGLYGDFTQPLRSGLELPVGDFLALAGARVCGVAFEADPVHRLLALMAWRSPEEPPAQGVEPPDGLDLPQWIARLTATLERHAAFALEVEEGTALPFLCAQPGRMAVSERRVDVAFALAAHPLSIRAAGLDRNPGWVPAAGRTFELHYQ